MASPNSEDQTPSGWAAPVVAYGVFAAFVIALLHKTAGGMLATWAQSSSYHHGFLVLPIVLWMILKKSETPSLNGARLPGFLILLGGALLWVIGQAATVALISQLALVTILIGGVGVIFGGGALQAWAYPLAFAYFMVPFGETVVPTLQILTAKIIVGLLSAFAMPVSIDGFLIHTKAGAFEVAEACAGLRFLIAATMIATMFAYTAFKSWRKRLLFLGFAVLLALLANGLRAFLMVLVATLTEKAWAVGPDHLLAGWAFYALIFAVLILTGRHYADQQSTAPQTSTIAPQKGASIYAVAAGLIVSGAAIFNAAIVSRPVDHPAPANLTLFNAPGWRILPPPENWRPALAHADRTVQATYDQDGVRVYLSVGYFTHDRDGAEIVTRENRAWNGDDWRQIGSMKTVVYQFGDAQERKLDILSGPQRRRLAVLNTYWVDGKAYSDAWRAKRAQMFAKLRGDNPPGGVIILAAAYQHDPSEAINALRAFTNSTEPLDAWLQRQTRN